jgi:hypothetical protein
MSLSNLRSLRRLQLRLGKRNGSFFRVDLAQEFVAFGRMRPGHRDMPEIGPHGFIGLVARELGKSQGVRAGRRGSLDVLPVEILPVEIDVA